MTPLNLGVFFFFFFFYHCMKFVVTEKFLSQQNTFVVDASLSCARLALLQCSALPHCRDIEHYVVTYETPCPRILCCDARYTLSKHNFRQLCRNIKFSIATRNLFTLVRLCRDIKMSYRNIESLAKAKLVATRRLQNLTSCRDRLGRDKETSIAIEK